MRLEEIDHLIEDLTERLKLERQEGGIWRGHLSSSAISTSVSVFALHEIDSKRYATAVSKGVEWLKKTMKEDGSWGDSVESPSNMTATLLSYASLYAVDTAPAVTRDYLTERLGGSSEEQIIDGVLKYYGKDLTFSVPILVMCAMAGVIHSWDKIPSFPFELAVLPQRFFRFLNLPVVSYAIPALIAVGILRYRKGCKGLLSGVRSRFIPSCLKVLTRLQPEDGGFLEAAPLTAFVSMCMSGAGYRDHIVTQKSADFLVSTVREDGSWPIDTDLSGWVTSLSIKALDQDVPNRSFLLRQIKSNQTKTLHPFTGAQAGGWGWSDLSGSVPDGDDTSGSLVALHILNEGKYCEEAEKGIRWLMALQNSDGGMPTFCRGWGKLPFDRSSADISAHALLAFLCWKDVMPADFKEKVEDRSQRLIRWMEEHQDEKGSWTPLWFGDQDTDDLTSPVYGTAAAVEYLAPVNDDKAAAMARRGREFLLQSQNADGGWGGKEGVRSKVSLTGKVLGALAAYPDSPEDAICRGVNYLLDMDERGLFFAPDPIGLYFSKLWYSENLYTLAFVLKGLKEVRKYKIRKG